MYVYICMDHHSVVCKLNEERVEIFAEGHESSLKHIGSVVGAGPGTLHTLQDWKTAFFPHKKLIETLINII